MAAPFSPHLCTHKGQDRSFCLFNTSNLLLGYVCVSPCMLSRLPRWKQQCLLRHLRLTLCPSADLATSRSPDCITTPCPSRALHQDHQSLFPVTSPSHPPLCQQAFPETLAMGAVLPLDCPRRPRDRDARKVVYLGSGNKGRKWSK